MMHNYDAELAALSHGIDTGEMGQVDEGEEIELNIPGTGVGPFGIGTTPGAVPAREESWNFDAKPFATYLISAGDTLSGLAITYLGNGERWPEIYNTGRTQAILAAAAIAGGMPPGPDVIMTSGPIDMPNDARANMINWLKKGKPGTTPGTTTPEKVTEKVGRLWPWLLGGAAIGIGVAAIASGRRR